MTPRRSAIPSTDRTVVGDRAAPEALERHTRRSRVEEIERLLAQDPLSNREIAGRVGLSPSTVGIYRRDPDGARQRARRAAYRGRCGRCGRPVSGGNGRSRTSTWCPECAPLQRRRWSDEDLLEAIVRWTAATGSPPELPDWSPGHAPPGHAGARRYLRERGRWPSASTIARRFGSLSAAKRQALSRPISAG